MSFKKKNLKCGTRGSSLALVQSRWVLDRLKKVSPDIAVEWVVITTSGDRFKGDRLAEAGGKGLFVKEIEEALLKNEIDFAVHSLKDLPGILPEALALAAYPRREDPRDAFVSEHFSSFAELPRGAVVGTSSPRREMQICSLRPDLSLAPMRGNIDTRLKKSKEGHYDAIILAAAGLHRLGLKENIRRYFDPEELVPSVGQGVLGIEVRASDKDLAEWLQTALEDKQTAIAARAERRFLKAIDGDCHTPLGGYARVAGEKLEMTGWLAAPDGSRHVYLKKSGSVSDPEGLGEFLAKEILDALAHHTTA